MSLWNDARFALRQIHKSPAFTMTVVLTLALCIGVNTAIFSVLDAVLFRPAPFPEPDRLAMLVTAQHGPSGEYIDTSQTGSLYESVRDRAAMLDCAAWSDFGGGANFAAPGRVEYVQQERVSAGFFRVMGIRPQLGREFTREEDVPGGAPLAIVSYAFWQRAFHGNANIIGSAITLKGQPYTVVGVMPREYRGTKPVDVWTPLHPSRKGEGVGSNYGVVARLRPGASWQAASEQLKALSQNLRDDPTFPTEVKDFEERIVPLQIGFAQEARRELMVTWGAVVMVLLIGCVNIAGLLLARSGSRGREIATRMALGGRRVAIVRQLLIESLLLAVAGGIAGLAIGGFALDWLKQLGADSHQLWHPIELNARVLAVMAGIALLTSVVFGLAPALATTRLDIRSVLVEGGRGMACSRRGWSRRALVAIEVALSLVLLVGAGLMVRTLSYLNGLTPGFDTHNVIAAEASLQDARYEQAAPLNQFYAATLEQIRRIPGVQSAAVALTLPYERPLNNGFRFADGADREGHTVEWVYAGTGYFETMRIPVLEGRAFRDSDTAETGLVAVVSRAFAAQFFPNGDAVGHHLAGKTPRTIVGIVGDVQTHSGLNGGGGPIGVGPTLYVPAAQLNGSLAQLHTWFSPKWVVRTNGPSPTITRQIQSAIASVDPQLPIAAFHTVDELAGRYTKSERYLAALFSMLAGLALLLAAIGLYGLISHSVAQRRHEIGIRLALGATARQTVTAVMRPGLVLAVVGVIAGLGLSKVAVGLMKSLIFGVRADDPMTFAVTAGILLLVAAAASLGPALRILKIDPAETLRSE